LILWTPSDPEQLLESAAWVFQVEEE